MTEENNTTIEFEFEGRDRTGTTIQRTKCLVTSTSSREAERLFIKFFQPNKKDKQDDRKIIVDIMKKAKELEKDDTANYVG